MELHAYLMPRPSLREATTLGKPVPERSIRGPPKCLQTVRNVGKAQHWRSEFSLEDIPATVTRVQPVFERYQVNKTEWPLSERTAAAFAKSEVDRVLAGLKTGGSGLSEPKSVRAFLDEVVRLQQLGSAVATLMQDGFPNR